MVSTAGALSTTAVAVGLWAGTAWPGAVPLAATRDDLGCATIAADVRVVLRGAGRDAFSLEGVLGGLEGPPELAGITVVLQVEGRRFDLPGDEFAERGGERVFRGPAGGADVEVAFRPEGDQVALHARGSGATLGTVYAPVSVSLRVGERCWGDSVRADIDDRRGPGG